jgi:predicted O-methyltransferase YrrM
MRRAVPSRRKPIARGSRPSVGQSQPPEQVLGPNQAIPIRTRTTEPTGLFPDARSRVVDLVWGYISSQVVGAIASFGIADELAGGPLSASELAKRVGLPAPSAHRLLRAAASIGILDEPSARVFALNDLSHFLRADVAGSVRAQAIAYVDPWQWLPWAHFRDALLTGDSTVEAALGQGLWDYLAAHPEQEARFAAAMGSSTKVLARTLATAVDLSRFGLIVDVGGSHGELVIEILRSNAAIRAVLFDLPTVARRASEALAKAGLSERCQVVGGDFFAEVPRSGDLYVLKAVLHDWPDPDAITILAKCREAMRAGGRIALVESILPPDGLGSASAHRSDLDMLVINGGRERTEAEFRRLLDAAGLKLDRVVPVSGDWAMLIAGAAGTAS